MTHDAQYSSFSTRLLPASHCPIDLGLPAAQLTPPWPWPLPARVLTLPSLIGGDNALRLEHFVDMMPALSTS
jgi:hypothetical protein